MIIVIVSIAVQGRIGSGGGIMMIMNSLNIADDFIGWTIFVFSPLILHPQDITP